MSESNEKKNQKGLPDTGGGGFKTAREVQKRKEEKRTNFLYGLIAVVFVVVAIVAVIWKSNIFQKTAVAATINDKSYNVPEVSYYYRTIYQNTINQLYSSGLLNYIGLDTQSSLKDQTISSTAAMFTGAEEGKTWYDYFMDQALEQMAQIQALNDAAKADNFEWNDEMQTMFDNSVNTLKETAASNGYTEGQYLTMLFGNTMSKSVYQEQLRQTIIADRYQQAYEDSLTYSDTELEDAYQEARDTYDRVSAQYIRVDGSVPAPAEDENADNADDSEESAEPAEPTEEEKAAAMDAAKAIADRLYASFQGGQSLETLADSEDTATYTKSEEMTSSTAILNTWLFDPARQAGDSAVLEDASGSAYYVVAFENRYRYEYNTIDVRHVLIRPEESTIPSDEEGYQEDVDAKKAEAKQKADDLLAEWKSGDATEDSFAKLAQDNSADSNADQGGLYEQVYKGQMVQAFNDWCFDENRKPGDTDVVETDFGYHIMYFVGENIPYWKVQVTDALKSEAVDSWFTEKTEGYTAEQADGIQYVS